LAPRAAFRILHVAYQVFPDSTAARGEGTARTEKVSLRRALSQALQGVYW
jgi:hypothetical protein